MSQKSIFNRTDSDASFNSKTSEILASRSPDCSSSMSDCSVELIDYSEPPTTDAEAAETLPEPRFVETIFVESSSDTDTGQATVGSSTSSGKKRGRPSKRPDVSDSSIEPGLAVSTTSTGTDGLTSETIDSKHLPKRRTVRLKSLVGLTDDSSPSQLSSVQSTMDKVCVSSSAEPQSESSEQMVDEASASQDSNKMRRLKVRLERISIEMANVKIASEKSTNQSKQMETSYEKSPRKLRARTPSTKCLESFNLEDLHLSPRRRTTRHRTPNKRYSDYNTDTATGRQGHRTPTKKDAENEEPSEDENEQINHDMAQKKSTLWYDQGTNTEGGQNLFSFRTPKKRDGMAQLAAITPKHSHTPKTPRTPKTPKHTQRKTDTHPPGTPKTPKARSNLINQTTKTPRRVRSILKKELSKFTKPDTSGSDFSTDSDNDYKPGDNSDASEDQSSNESEESLSSDSSSPVNNVGGSKKRYCPPSVVNKTPISGRPTRMSTRKQNDFVPESEDYFNHHTNKKAITSDRTLDRMKTPRLPNDHLFQLLAKTSLSAAHEQSITEMHQDYRQYFSKWLFTLNEGFSIILHGLGSKRNLLQQFHQDVLSEHKVLVVNGFFPSLTIKDILDCISVELLQLQITSRNYHAIVDSISDALDGDPSLHVFLIVHNIDGVMLRNDSAQLVLSRLAKIDQIHLIASMDHINGPLLWDHTKLSNFNFSWWDITIMLPYTEEIAFENSMLVNQSGGLALSSMKNVFLSLTQNSREIFLVIVRNQLNNKGNSSFQGMAFKDLYSRCRENFLVSSDVALRSQLTEFIDHNLVKMKRTSDGIEHLLIPLDSGLLEQFLELQENNL